MFRTATTISGFLLLASACGGSDGGGSDLEGIFELASWTNNPTSCDAEGGSAFEESMYTHFFVRHDEFFGEGFLDAVMCEDLEECRMKAADTDTIYIGNFSFDGGNDDDGWTGNSGFLGGDTCDGTVQENVLTGVSGESILIRGEAKTVHDVPKDSDDFCDFDAAAEQAADLPCEQLTVVTGTYLDGI